MSRLPSPSPGVIAGSLAPPVSRAARLSMRRSPFCFVGPWHSRQVALSTGGDGGREALTSLAADDPGSRSRDRPDASGAGDYPSWPIMGPLACSRRHHRNPSMGPITTMRAIGMWTFITCKRPSSTNPQQCSACPSPPCAVSGAVEGERAQHRNDKQTTPDHLHTTTPEARDVH